MVEHRLCYIALPNYDSSLSRYRYIFNLPKSNSSKELTLPNSSSLSPPLQQGVRWETQMIGPKPIQLTERLSSHGHTWKIIHTRMRQLNSWPILGLFKIKFDSSSEFSLRVVSTRLGRLSYIVHARPLRSKSASTSAQDQQPSSSDIASICSFKS